MVVANSTVRTVRTRDAVRALYEVYPYPSPVVGDSLIEDVANGVYSLYGENPLRGSRVLDAGCGTGHRLVALARRYPQAQFTGIDMTAASLEVARRLANKHGVTNLQLEQADLMSCPAHDEFDLVISTGVLVCLENPQQGLRNLAASLRSDGLLMVWLYHEIGEHDRLLDRELLHVMWSPHTGFERGVQMMRDLGLTLEFEQYGSSAAQQSREISQLSIDVDAYVHPIVNVYRFEQALELFRGCRELGWAAINSFNSLRASRLVDLAEAEHSEMRYFCQPLTELFDDDSLRTRFRELDTRRKLQAMEIKLKPTGFTVVGGRERSFELLGPRITGNAVTF